MKAAARLSALRGAALMTAATPVSFALGLTASAVIARALGPDLFGRYAYLVWLSGLLVLLATNALPTSGLRFISESLGRRSEREAQILHRWLRSRQIACIAAACGVSGIVLWLGGGDSGPVPAGTVAVLVTIAVAARSLYMFDTSIAKGYGHYSVEAVCTIAVSATSLVAVLLIAANGGSIVAFLVAFAVSGIGYAALAALMNRRAGIVASRGLPDAAQLARMYRHIGWTTLLTTAGLVANRSVETFLLNALVGSAEVGYFVIAAALTRGGAELLTAGLSAVLMTTLAHAFGAQGSRLVAALLSDAVRYFQFAGLLLAGVGLCWSEPLVQLIYGPAYLPVVDVVRTMLVVAGVVLPGSALGAVLSTTDHQRLRALIALASVLLSVIAAAALIPRFGLAGAVAAHAASTLSIHALTVRLVYRTIDARLPWQPLRRQVGAALFAGAASCAVLLVDIGMAGQLLAGLAFGATLVTASILLRAWTDRDAERVVRLTSARLTGFGGLRRLIDRCAMRAAAR